LITDLIGDGIYLVDGSCGNDDHRSFASETEADGSADTSATASDDSYFPFKSHEILLDLAAPLPESAWPVAAENALAAEALDQAFLFKQVPKRCVPTSASGG
jgi:hypothetical protein